MGPSCSTYRYEPFRTGSRTARSAPESFPDEAASSPKTLKNFSRIAFEKLPRSETCSLISAKSSRFWWASGQSAWFCARPVTLYPKSHCSHKYLGGEERIYEHAFPAL